MQITISTRNDVQLDHLLREQINTMLSNLTRFGGSILEANVVLDQPVGGPQIDVRLHRGMRTQIIASAQASDFRTAVDVVGRKLRRRLVRAKRVPAVRRQAPA